MIRLDDLQILDYKIYQDSDLYNFSTDAVLLANFSEFGYKDKVVDLCSGVGVVGILAAIKNFYKKMYLVEIQPSLANLAQKSVEYNKLENVEVICDDVKNLRNYFSGGEIDVVLCNPPYFRCDGKKMSENEHLNICNFEVKICLEDIIATSENLLKFGGKLYMINDIDRLEETICLLNKHKFRVKILQIVNPKKDKNANVFLVKAVKNAKSGIKVLPNLILNDDDGNFLVKVKKGKYER